MSQGLQLLSSGGVAGEEKGRKINWTESANLNPFEGGALHLLLADVGDLLGEGVHEVAHDGGEHPIPPVVLRSLPKKKDN